MIKKPILHLAIVKTLNLFFFVGSAYLEFIQSCNVFLSLHLVRELIECHLSRVDTVHETMLDHVYKPLEHFLAVPLSHELINILQL